MIAIIISVVGTVVGLVIGIYLLWLHVTTMNKIKELPERLFAIENEVSKLVYIENNKLKIDARK